MAGIPKSKRPGDADLARAVLAKALLANLKSSGLAIARVWRRGFHST